MYAANATINHINFCPSFCCFVIKMFAVGPVYADVKKDKKNKKKEDKKDVNAELG